jgi:transketolase
MEFDQLAAQAKRIRQQMMSVLRPKESHHIGCALGVVDLLAFLYFSYLNVFPENPRHLDRDIFILSKGHAALALYATLQLRGFFPQSLLTEYDQDGGHLPEHASASVPGIEVSSGSLGHGLSIGIGFALAFRQQQKNNEVVVLLSDGELNEGSNWEAIMFAGFHQLSHLTVVVDVNGFQGYGDTKDVLDLQPLDKKWQDFGWDVSSIDGDNFSAINAAFRHPTTLIGRPRCILAKTVKGKGVEFFEGKFASHYRSVTDEEKNSILHKLEGAL